MPIQRLRTRDLSEGERADLEAALRDYDRYRYEDRQIFVMLLVLAAAWLMVAEVFLLYEVRKWHGRPDDPLQSFEGFFAALPESLSLLLQPNLFELVGFVGLPFVMVALVVHAWRTGKSWNGYALASFGFVRVRGDSLAVLRYEHISEVRLRKKSETFYGRNCMRLAVLDEKGASLVAVGSGYESWKDRIEARQAGTKAVNDPGKRG